HLRQDAVAEPHHQDRRQRDLGDGLQRHHEGKRNALEDARIDRQDGKRNADRDAHAEPSTISCAVTHPFTSSSHHDDMILSMITDGLGRMKSGTLNSQQDSSHSTKMTAKMPSTGPLLTIQARTRPIFIGAAVVAAIAMNASSRAAPPAARSRFQSDVPSPIADRRLRSRR